MKRFLILGHPRSGTLYMTYMFERVGLHVGHEIDEAHVLKIHGVHTHFDGYVTGVWKNMDYAPGAVDVVLHMTRHPIGVISSCRRAQGRLGHAIIKRFRPDLMKGLRKDLLYRMMLSWLVFTDHADIFASYHFQLEQAHSKFKHICHNILDVPVRKGPAMMQRVNVTRHKDYTWEELALCDKGLTDRIQEKCVNYGYPLAYRRWAGHEKGK